MVFKFQSYTGGGPTPKFSLFHVWKAYDVIYSQGPIGRKALSDALGIGEGSTRTILDKMMKEGSLDNTKQGAVLSERGRKKYKNSGIIVCPIRIDGLTVGTHDCAVLVKGMAERVGTGAEQRDEAVRAGALGATTLVFRGNRLFFPTDPDKPDQGEIIPLRSSFNLEENDAVIVGTANSYEDAERGAVTAALSLSEISRGGLKEPGNLLSPDAESDDLRSIALAIHELMGHIPVTMRTRNSYGVRCEDGEVIDANYTGPVLEETMMRGQVIRKVAPSGPYRGVPVVVVPIIKKKEAIAAIGIVDMSKGAVLERISRARSQQGS